MIKKAHIYKVEPADYDSSSVQLDQTLTSARPAKAPDVKIPKELDKSINRKDSLRYKCK